MEPAAQAERFVKTMKILVGGIYHETHSFSNVPTDIESFRRVLLLNGDEVIEQLKGTESEMAGFVVGAQRFGLTLIPTIWAWGLSAGPVRTECLDYFIDLVGRRIEGEEQLDGVLFALHGACVGERGLDGDCYIISRLRSYLGKRTPIAVTLDFHANISKRLLDLVDIIVGYDTYPHIDQMERGLEAAELLVRIVKGEIEPVMALEKPPMLIVPYKQATGAYPMHELLTVANACEREALAITVSGGFPYADVHDAGPGVVVITDNQPELAQRLAREIASRMWQLREEFVPRLPNVKRAVTAGIESKNCPVILADLGDNIGAGTPGDGTFILQELIEQRAESAVVTIADPIAVGHAIEVGVGKSVNLSIGAKCDRLHGEPVELECYVRLISDGVFTNRGHMRHGVRESMGRTAVVEALGIQIVLTENKLPPWNLEQLRSLGITPESQRIIVAKSALAFRAAYEPIAGSIIEVDTPGLSAVDLRQFDYRHVRRPIFPLDAF
jgi:microcystin degradation protein MlrC